MTQMKHQLLRWLLTVCAIVCLFTVSAFADEADPVSAVTETGTAMAGDLIDLGAGLTQNLVTGSADLASSFVETVSGGMIPGDLIRMGADAASDLIGTAAGITKELAGGAMSIPAQAAQTGSQAVSQLIPGVGNTGSDIASALAESASGLAQANAQNLERLAENTGSVVSQLAQSGLSGTSGLIQSANSGMANLISGTANDLVSGLTGSSLAGDLTGGLAGTGLSLMSNLTNAAVSGLDQIARNLLGGGTDLLTALLGGGTRGLGDLMTLPTSLLPGTEVLNDALTGGADLVSSLIPVPGSVGTDSLTSVIRDLGSSFADSVSGTVRSLASAAPSDGSALGSLLGTGLPVNMASAGSSVLEQLQEQARTLAENTVRAASDNAGTAGLVASDFASELQGLLQNLSQGAVRMAEGTSSAGEGLLEELMNVTGSADPGVLEEFLESIRTSAPSEVDRGGLLSSLLNSFGTAASEGSDGFASLLSLLTPEALPAAETEPVLSIYQNPMETEPVDFNGAADLFLLPARILTSLRPRAHGLRGSRRRPGGRCQPRGERAMYLKSLTLKGFKSFADRTHMVFDPGLTVVVGPNGSGKSNVSDSILWVLGEQSAKQLRGQAMEDVIFSGSSARKPVGLAEVTLVLDNTDHTLPIDFSEVAITRRMYRSGESEYLINNAPCRLMDITDILHDSGLGKDTHSIISQGKLDSILASRPEERRSLIEEAAGISKHRRRKERSERKLRSMQENLTRAKDIQREIGRQLRPLERQVDKAKRHRDLSERLREISATLAVDDLRLLQENYARLTARGNEAEAAVELAQYRTGEKERELEKLQTLLEQKGLFVGDLGEQRRRMQDVLSRMEADMRLLEEKGRNMVSRLSEMRMSLSSAEKQRNDTAAEKERVSEQLGDARVKAANLSNRVHDLQQEAKKATELRRSLGNQYAQLVNEQRQSQRTADTETLAYAKLEDQISNAKLEDEMFESRLAQIAETLATAQEALSERTSRREQLARELDEAQRAAEQAEAAIRECRQAIDAARGNESKAREKLSKARATLSALESVDEQNENASGLTAAVAASDEGLELVECRLADLIEVPAELDELVERLLGDDLAALVVDANDDAARLASAAADMGRANGRATILSLGSRGADVRADAPGDRLLDRLGCDPKASGMLAALLGDVRVVEDATAAVRAHEQAPDLTFVTESGITVLPDGRIVVGADAGAEKGALERKRRIRALQEGMAELEAGHVDAQEALSQAEAALADARDASARAKGEVARIRGEHQSIGSEIGRLEAQRNQATSEQAQVSKRRAAASQKADEARPQIEKHRAAARAAEQRVVEIGEKLEELSGERSRASRAENEANERVADARLELATTMERRNNLERREHDLTKTLADLGRRRDAAERSARSLEVLRLRVDPLYDRYDAIHSRAMEWAELLRDRSRLAEADSDSLKATIGDARQAVNEASAQLQAARDAANEVKVEMGRVEVQVENAINAIVSQGFVLDEALTLPQPDDRAAMEAEAESLKRKIANIGPVNEVAMDEYLRLKERADYIDEQVADLERARAALAKITSAIERKMRRQFLVIFDAVNANFAEVFAMLFPGGQAHLEMTDPDHLSETGIEVVAQPRGKRIQKMMLMSGGEKSLTALALLFAVYKTRTVPFYVFDEVEAALDDSNLSKLLDAIEQLKDTTQLIVISHQRRTMEQADVLYGVSMQADGVSHVVSQRLDRATGKVVDA